MCLSSPSSHPLTVRKAEEVLSHPRHVGKNHILGMVEQEEGTGFRTLWGKPSPVNLPSGPCRPGGAGPLSLQPKPCCDLTGTLFPNSSCQSSRSSLISNHSPMTVAMEMNDLAGQLSPPLQMEPGQHCQAHVGWEWGSGSFPKGIGGRLLDGGDFAG